MSNFTESQLQVIIDLVEKIKEEEEILCSMKEDEYEKWNYGDRDTYDKMKGQRRIDNQKRYIDLLKSDLSNIMNGY